MCPLCFSCLLSSLGGSSAAFCHFGLLSHPILLLFFAWVYFFGVYLGLGLRCCGPGYGSSLLLGGSLSLVLVVLAWLLQLFRFVQVTWVSWIFCLGFFLSTSSVSLVVQSGLRLMFQFCPVSSLAVRLSGLFFREQLLLASAFEAPRSCLALALRFSLDGFMVRTLSFHFQVSTWFFVSIFWVRWR